MLLTAAEICFIRAICYNNSTLNATSLQACASPPSRRAESGGKNVPVRYPSRKMGVVIQAESRTVEFARVYLMEHDPVVLEFWDQPPLIKLQYSAKTKIRTLR